MAKFIGFVVVLGIILLISRVVSAMKKSNQLKEVIQRLDRMENVIRRVDRAVMDLPKEKLERETVKQEEKEPVSVPVEHTAVKDEPEIVKPESKPNLAGLAAIASVPKVEEKPMVIKEDVNTFTEPEKFRDIFYGKSEPETKPEREKNQFESKASEIVNNIWMWLIVGEDYRRKDISREYAIASTWLVRLAVIILLAGGAFFLKYSIEHGLIAPVGRVIISSIAAFAMLGVGLFLGGPQKKYDLIGRGLSGGSIALMYFTVYASTNMYHLTSSLTGFILMCVVTLGACIISVRKNMLLMAILGIVGGYLTPILLSTGDKNLYGLFGYLLLLGSGTLVISKYRDWKLLNWMSFIASYLIFFMATDKFYYGVKDYVPVMIFATGNFILFSLMTVSFNIFNRRKVTLLELLTMLVNTTIFFWVAAAYTISDLGMGWTACYSLCAAVFFAGHAAWLVVRRCNDRKLLTILMTLSCFCLIVTVPLLLGGVWIAATWAVMAVTLLYLSLKLGSKTVMGMSAVVYMITAIRVFMYDYQNLCWLNGSQYWNGLVEHILSGGLLCLAFGAGYMILRHFSKRGDNMPEGVISAENDLGADVSLSSAGYTMAGFAVALGFLFFNIEIPRFTHAFYGRLCQPLTALLWGGMLIYLVWTALRTKWEWLRALAGLFLFVFSCKLLTYDIAKWHFSFSDFAFCGSFDLAATLLRSGGWITAIVMMTFGYFLLRQREASALRKMIGATTIIQLFIFLTLETSSVLYHFAPGFREAGVSIMWGLFAFGMIAGGIRGQIRGLRMWGLVLFALDGAKVFLFDLHDLSQLYRIIACIVIGLVFLAGGFIYIKCRDLFKIEDKDQAEAKPIPESMA